MELEWMNLRNSRMSQGDDLATAKAYASANLIDDILYLNIFNKANDALFTSDGKLVSDASIIGDYAEDLDWFDYKRWKQPIVRKSIADGGSFHATYAITLNPSDANNWTWVIPKKEKDYNKLIK